MMITAVKLYILEQPGQMANGLKLVQLPNLLRIQYTPPIVAVDPAAATSLYRSLHGPGRQRSLHHQYDARSTGGVAQPGDGRRVPSTREHLTRNCTKARAGCIRRPAGSATSTTACGILQARTAPACRCLR